MVRLPATSSLLRLPRGLFAGSIIHQHRLLMRCLARMGSAGYVHRCQGCLRWCRALRLVLHRRRLGRVLVHLLLSRATHAKLLAQQRPMLLIKILRNLLGADAGLRPIAHFSSIANLVHILQIVVVH